MKRAGKQLRKIVTATSVAIFSLFASVSGVYAWFKSTTTYETQADFFSVVNYSISIEELKLIKFDYPVLGDIQDYLNPYDGTVGEYLYNDDPNIKAFGYYDDHEDPTTWHTVTMNRYDPVRIEIGDELEDQYCNVVYAVTVSSNFESTFLKVFANHFNKAKQEKEIYLSDCLDFDVFTEEDIETVNTTCFIDIDVTGVSSPYVLDFYGKAGGEGEDVKYFEYSSSSEESQTDLGVNFKFVETYVENEKTYARFTYDLNPFCLSEYTFSSIQLNSSELSMDNITAVRPDYYPDYIYDYQKADPTYDPDFSAKGASAELYFKISYLASQKESHAHFYGLADKSAPLPIHDPNNLETLTYETGTTTFYLNVNYAPSQLERYSTDLIHGVKTAVFDYYFSIDI